MKGPKCLQQLIPAARGVPLDVPGNHLDELIQLQRIVLLICRHRLDQSQYLVV